MCGLGEFGKSWKVGELESVKVGELESGKVGEFGEWESGRFGECDRMCGETQVTFRKSSSWRHLCLRQCSNRH